MFPGRKYQVTFSGVTCAAAQDLVQIVGATGKLLLILRQWVGPASTTLATGQGMRLRSRFLPATVTVGSGGTTGITPSKSDPGDAACSATTCATNNTTQATTSGTAVVQYEGGCHYFQGHMHVFDKPVPVHVSTAFVFELLNTPTGTVVLSGGVEILEVG